jgi:hypothetical protein
VVVPQSFGGFLQESGSFSFVLPAQHFSFGGTGLMYNGNAANSIIYTNRQNDNIEAFNFKYSFLYFPKVAKRIQITSLLLWTATDSI